MNYKGIELRPDWIYRRGDIYLANLNPFKGSEQGGTRPVLVLQNNDGNYYCPTLIVAPITTKLKKLNMPTHCYFEKVRSLAEPSMVSLEQIKTIDKCRIEKYLGKMTWEHTDQLKEVSGRSDFRANLEISAYDRVLTLSTCAYRFENARYVLHGKLVELR